tara:strand:- start:1190 stop:1366 length:177 start_codon:yes stop_codon:yes gene_type:complete
VKEDGAGKLHDREEAISVDDKELDNPKDVQSSSRVPVIKISVKKEIVLDVRNLSLFFL